MPLPATIGLFAAAFALLAWPWLSGAVTIPWDAKAQFQPQLQFLAASLARGEAPFWTPHVFAGWPQIADPQSLIFSAPHLAAALIDPTAGFRTADATSFAMLFAGGLGIILLFRDRGWHAGGALVAALAFAFGGSAASRLQHTGQILSIAYLPLALWLIARMLERRSLTAAAAAGVAAGLMALGRDQVAMLGLYLLAAYAIVHAVSGGGRALRLRASLAPLVLCAAAFLLVAAGPVLLTALLAEASNRPEIDYLSAGAGSLHPAHLLMLAFADLYGAADPAVDFWGPPSFPWMHAFSRTGLYLAQNVGQIYAGALPLLAVLGLGLIRGGALAREIRFFSVALVVLLLYALGWYTPAFRVIYELVPGVDLFRRPADATFLIGFLYAVVAGYLVHRWLAETLAPPSRRQRALELALAAGIVAVAVAVALQVGRLPVATVPILSGIVLAAAAVAVLMLVRRARPRWRLAAGLLPAVFLTADLAWNNAPNESTGLPPATYAALRPDTGNETVALLKARLAEGAASGRRDRVELAGIGYHWPNLSLAHGFDQLLGHNPLRLRDFARATGVGDTVATPDQRGFAPLFPSYRSTLADLFGLRLIATGVPVERIDGALKPGDLNFIARTGDAYVYENPRALPRAMLVPGWRLADFEALLGSGWPGDDPRQTVLLEHAPAGFAAGGAGAGGPGTARIVRYRNTEVVVEVEAPAGGLLVLNDVWHPWWRATVDGTAADILKANVLFRAVAVGPGRHEVRFTFAPWAGALRELRARLGNRL